MLVPYAAVILIGLWNSVLSADFKFDQDVAFRSTYEGMPKVADWSSVPFNALASGDSVTHVGSTGDCFAVLHGSNLFTSFRKRTEDKIALKNPFSEWASVLEISEGASVLTNSLNEKFDLFAMTSSNIAGLKFGFDGQCSKVIDQHNILPNDVKWGNVLAISSSALSLWVASTELGLSQVSIADGSVTQISLPDMSIKSIKYVPEWNKLFVGTTTALYTLKFTGPSTNEHLLHHEWITGVIDSVPLGFSFDTTNNALWLAQSGAVHKLDTQGRWWRYGYHQGAPFGNITSVTAVDGYVYVGSQMGLAKFRGSSNPAQVDTLSRTDERCNFLIDSASSAETTNCVDEADPWVWSFYGGQRYLPDNNVVSLTASSAALPGSSGTGTVVLATTSTGTLQLQTAKWTLVEKSSAFEQFQYPRHDRSKLTSSCGLTVYGDVSTFYRSVSDNDGLWTGMHAIGEAYNYAATGNQLARKEAWRAFEALEMIQNVTGAFPTFPARSYCYIANGDAGCGTQDGENHWHESTTYEGVMWKGDTSSDEMNGHYAALPVLYDLVAESPDEKQRVYTIINGLTQSLIDHDLYLIDPTTGEPTTWGFWNPSEVNGNPEHYSERGLNSLEILSYLSTAYSITRRAVFKDTFNKLITEHGYLLNTMNVKIDNPDDDNHSDNELITLAYHALFYSWQRVSQQDEPEFKAEMWSMVSPFLPSFERTWLIIGAEYSPLWTGIYAGVAAQKVSSAALKHSVWTLRRWAIDLIDWPVDNDGRWDITKEPFYSRDSTRPIMRQIRPAAERTSSHWNSDPYSMMAGSGYSEYEPAVWRMPYYIMLHYKLI